MPHTDTQIGSQRVRRSRTITSDHNRYQKSDPDHDHRVRDTRTNYLTNRSLIDIILLEWDWGDHDEIR